MSTTEINDQLQVRRDKMEDLRQNGIDPFGQRFDRTHLSSELVEEFGAFSKEELEEKDRIYFEHCVLSAFKIDNYYDRIKDTIINMQKNRIDNVK